jgi:hypothetical protein
MCRSNSGDRQSGGYFYPVNKAMMNNLLRFIIPALLSLLVFCGAQLTEKQTARGYHTSGELNFFRGNDIGLPWQTTVSSTPRAIVTAATASTRWE